MRLTIEIDEESGFCYGVIRAVQKAEMKLKESSTLYSLGSIVHNNSELDRLNKIGLEVIDLEQMKNLSDMSSSAGSRPHKTIGRLVPIGV